MPPAWWNQPMVRVRNSPWSSCQRVIFNETAICKLNSPKSVRFIQNTRQPIQFGVQACSANHPDAYCVQRPRNHTGFVTSCVRVTRALVPHIGRTMVFPMMRRGTTWVIDQSRGQVLVDQVDHPASWTGRHNRPHTLVTT